MTDVFKVVWIALSVILTATLIVTVSFSIYQSKEIVNTGMEQINVSKSFEETNFIGAVVNSQVKSISTASAYVLIVNNFDKIYKCSCSICGKTHYGVEAGECLKSHLNGRVIINYTDNGDKTYNISLHKSTT